MRLSEYEQRMLDEIQRGVQAEDPKFFASMAGSRRSRVGSVWGSVAFLFGLVAFVFGAVLAQALPWWGVVVSVAGFLIMFWGVWMICSGDRVPGRRGQDAALRRRVARLWDSMKDPPPQGMSP